LASDTKPGTERKCGYCSVLLPEGSAANRKYHVECAPLIMAAQLLELAKRRRMTSSATKARCKICDNGFSKVRANQLYCSDSCRVKGMAAAKLKRLRGSS